MKKILFGFLALLATVSACSDDHQEEDDEVQVDGRSLVTPRISVRVADQFTQKAFTGILEVYPCNQNQTTYFGNYVNGKLTPFNGYYTIVNGQDFGNNNRNISLPINTYNMVYWGTPKYDEPIYNQPAVKSPGMTVGANVSDLYFSLRANQDSTYMPVYDLVYAMKTVQIGEEDIQATLSHVGAGLKIIAQMQQGKTFSPNITSIQARIGSIAEKLNFYTAEPSNMTKTVKFDLEYSADSTSMSNPTVMLFPSGPNPLLELFITLKDGTIRKLSKNLSATLSANTMLTLNIMIGEILVNENSGTYSITDWKEENESIDFPIVN